jgi:DNA-binding NarL/FixJ family response regulator
MDIKMPGMNGIEATRQILNTSPHVGILIVTMFDDGDSVFAAMRAGARGYLLRDADLDELVRAINAVYQGEAIFSPAIARPMVQYFASRPTDAARSFPELTDREREILALMAQGQNNEVIVSRLILSIWP